MAGRDVTRKKRGAALASIFERDGIHDAPGGPARCAGGGGTFQSSPIAAPCRLEGLLRHLDRLPSWKFACSRESLWSPGCRESPLAANVMRNHDDQMNWAVRGLESQVVDASWTWQRLERVVACGCVRGGTATTRAVCKVGVECSGVAPITISGWPGIHAEFTKRMAPSPNHLD